MTQRPTTPARALPPGGRIDLVQVPTPEFARWLYAAVGGPWRWTDRLGWSREQWRDDLARPGLEIYVLYAGGAPAGYLQLDAEHHAEDGNDDPADDGAWGASQRSSVEIVYLGLLEHAIGRGLGGVLLGFGIERAWSLPQRRALAPARDVWLHTCDLDGPHALANYQARGFVITTECTEEQDYPVAPLGAWASTGGPL